MANDFKNTQLVTRYAVKEFLNALTMTMKVDRQLDQSRVFSGKIGGSVAVRRPVLFEAADGATLVKRDIEEGTVTVSLDQRKHVGFAVLTEDLTLKIEDANERYIKPAMNELAQQVESSISDSYKEVYNFVGVPGTQPSTFLDVANVGQKLDDLGVPMDDRCAFYDPAASNALADGLRTVFPQSIAKKAIDYAEIGMYAGLHLYKSQSLQMHTVGDYAGTPLVNGAAQNVTYLTSKDSNSQTLITDGWTAGNAIFNAGDIFTLAGVNSVNRRTRQTTGVQQQFVVLADVTADGSGNATITISPPIITSGAFQTVTAIPADNAAIVVRTGVAGDTHRQNLAFHKNAITLAMAQLDTPNDGATSSRQNFKDVSIRTVRQYDINDDELNYRFDILYGVKVINPGFAVRTTG